MSDILATLKGLRGLTTIEREALEEITLLRADNERLRAALASVEIYLTRGGASRSRIAEIARTAHAGAAKQEAGL